MLKSKTREPLFSQLKALLLDQIGRGKLKEGDRIPTTAELCDEHAVSSITVRRAVSDLVAQGVLTGVRGKGTFVALGRRASAGAAPVQDRLISIVIPDLASGPFFSEIIQGAESYLTPRGYSMVVGISNRDAAKERDVLLDIYSKGIRAALLTATSGDAPVDPAVLELLERDDMKLVFVDRKREGVSADYVASDNEQSGYLAASHLLDAGHRRIGFIHSHPCVTFDERIRGYRRALSERGVEFDRTLVRGGDDAATSYHEAGYVHALELFHHAEPPTALMGGNDAITMGALRACSYLGKSVPGDVSVVGNDNLAPTAYTSPPLTTVHQPKEEMGRRAAEMLMERIEGFAGPPRELRMATRLVERESTSPPAAGAGGGEA